MPGGDARTHWDATADYAATFYSARCYAREWLRQVAEGQEPLVDAGALLAAAETYDWVAGLLRAVWLAFAAEAQTGVEARVKLAQTLLKARDLEMEAVGLLQKGISAE